MKPAHATAKLLHDLKKHVESVNPGSEPFAPGLKAVADTAWELVNARGIDWAACGTPTQYAFRVRTFTVGTDALEETYATQPKPPKAKEFTPYEVTQRKLAERTMNQFGHTCTWVGEMFCEALNSGKLNGREQLRCLKGKAAHEATTVKRIEEIKARMAGRKLTGSNPVAEFVARHGAVYFYRERMYPTRKEALAAMEADTKAIPVDHDYVVMLFEDAFPPEGIEEQKVLVLESYLRSKDHNEARAMSEQIGVSKLKLDRHDKTIQLLLTAERRLAALDDPLPPKVFEKIGVSKTFLRNLMVGKTKNKATIRAALREKLYQLSPQRKPRKKAVGV